MEGERIDVIATTVSGSIADWKKVERIVPLFHDHGFDDVHLHVADGHTAARTHARDAADAGGRVVIAAGGSGTFRAVLEGCIDSGVPPGDIRLGFLRKGSADLIGKVLGMPDAIEEAIDVFADSIRAGATMPCDVLLAESGGDAPAPMHFVGYGGAGIFGRIPHFTENRFMKWYKGVLGQLFGDLGPFTTGMSLAMTERMLKGPFAREEWSVVADGREVARGRYHTLVILNGYLGPDLAFTRDPLGSGHFHLFALKYLGARRLPRQLVAARTGAVTGKAARWGFESFVANDTLELIPARARPFPANVDGSTFVCTEALRVRRVDRIALISRTT